MLFRQLLILAAAGILTTPNLNRFAEWLIPDAEVAAHGPNPVRMAHARARAGLSMIELIIIVAIIGIFGTIIVLNVGAFFGGAGSGVQVDASEQARAYAAGMGYTNPRVQCVGWDSDGDGYVSCTIAFDQMNGTIGKDAVECAAGFNIAGAINDGCRTPKIPLNVNR